jgi:hypothetical protein
MLAVLGNPVTGVIAPTRPTSSNDFEGQGRRVGEGQVVTERASGVQEQTWGPSEHPWRRRRGGRRVGCAV